VDRESHSPDKTRKRATEAPGAVNLKVPNKCLNAHKAAAHRNACVCTCLFVCVGMCRVGQNRIHTPYMNV